MAVFQLDLLLSGLSLRSSFSLVAVLAVSELQLSITCCIIILLCRT